MIEGDKDTITLEFKLEEEEIIGGKLIYKGTTHLTLNKKNVERIAGPTKCDDRFITFGNKRITLEKPPCEEHHEKQRQDKDSQSDPLPPVEPLFEISLSKGEGEQKPRTRDERGDCIPEPEPEKLIRRLSPEKSKAAKEGFCRQKGHPQREKPVGRGPGTSGQSVEGKQRRRPCGQGDEYAVDVGCKIYHLFKVCPLPWSNKL